MRVSGRIAGAGWCNLALLLVAITVGTWVIYESQRLMRADLLAVGTRKQVGNWASGAAEPTSQLDWDDALATLTAAQTITPDNPGLQEAIGDLHMVAGRRVWADMPLRLRHFGLAAAQYRAALNLRPADPQTWASLAAAYQGAGDTGSKLHQAWAKALALGPNEGHVQPMLLETALATWAVATPQMQAWAQAFFAASADPQRKAINQMAQRYGLRFDLDQPALPGAAGSAQARSRGSP